MAYPKDKMGRKNFSAGGAMDIKYILLVLVSHDNWDSLNPTAIIGLRYMKSETSSEVVEH